MFMADEPNSSPKLRQGGWIEKIIEFSAHNKLLIFVLTAVAIATAVTAGEPPPLKLTAGAAV